MSFDDFFFGFYVMFERRVGARSNRSYRRKKIQAAIFWGGSIESRVDFIASIRLRGDYFTR